MTKRGRQKPSGKDKAAGPPQADPSRPVFAMHEPIGRQLEALFDAVVAQPLPEKLRKLLADLERKQSKT
jgi:hypothetical protein